MEVSYQFILGHVAVAGSITASRNAKGGITNPATKYKIFKPGLLAQFAGPYEDNLGYMKYLETRFSLDPNMGSTETVEDVKWYSGKEELDMQSFMATMIRLLKDGKRHAEGRMNEKDSEKFEREWDELMVHPFAKALESQDPEEQKIKNLKVNHVILTEGSANGYESNRMGIGDYFVNTKTFKTFNDTPQFEAMRADIEKFDKNQEAVILVDISKKMNKYKAEAKNNSEYATTILRNVINEHHFKYTGIAQPLYFHQIGPHTNWKWMPFED